LTRDTSTGDSGARDNDLYTNLLPSIGEWHFYSFVYDVSNGKKEIFMDGELSAATTTSIDDFTSTDASYIGFGYSTNVSANGSLDEVRVYNRALSSTEVKSLYNKNKTQYQSSQKEYHKKGLVGYWSFDGADVDWSSTTAEILDRSGNGSNGDAVNGPKATIGKIGQGLEFDGNDDYVDVGSFSQLLVSFGLWVNFSTTTDSVLDFSGDPYLTSNLGTLSSGFSSPTYYVNGVATSSISIGWNYIFVTSDLTYTTPSFDIGRKGSDYFDGKIDELRIYDYKLSSDEITALYNSGKVKLNR